MVTTKLNLSMTEPQVRQIYAKQGDTGRVLDISLDQTPEDGTLRILRPDGVEVTSEAVTGGEGGETFETLAEADVTELTVGIEPVQDLNGYDKPWVGGAGKNKFDVSSYDLTSQWTNVSGVITNVGNPLSGNYIGCSLSGRSTTALSAGTYTFSLKARLVSGEYTVGTFNALRLHTNGADVKDFTKVSNPRISNVFQTYYGVLTLDESYTFEDINLQFATGLSNAVFEIKEIQIESGSTATAWQPYSNICPITGHDEVTVTRTGINVWDEEWEQGNISDQTGENIPQSNIIRSKNYIPVKPSTTYYSTMQAGGIFLYGANKQYLGSLYPGFPTNFTTPNNCYFIRFRETGAYGNTYNHDISINYPSTDHDYHAYQGSTYTTSLGQTVYGGTLDMVSGVLTVTHAIVDLSSLSWTYDGSVPRFYSYGIQNTVKAPSLNSEIADIICTQYISTSLDGDVSLYGGLNGSVAVSTGKVIFIRDEAYTSASTFKDAMEGVMLCYALATPVEYQLTAQQIKTLVGTNNVWASSGDIVNITFTYGGLLSELPSEATSVVGKCYCDVEQNGVSSMPFTLNVKKNERES